MTLYDFAKGRPTWPARITALWGWPQGEGTAVELRDVLWCDTETGEFEMACKRGRNFVIDRVAMDLVTHRGRGDRLEVERADVEATA